MKGKKNILLSCNTARIAWNSRNKKYYENLGYHYTKMRECFDVMVDDLPDYSCAKINVVCDYCGREFQTKWSIYRHGKKNGNFTDCCSNPSCTGKKALESVHLKYGELGTHNPISAQKRFDTNMQKYGSKNVFGSDAIKEKIRQTNIEKYGYGCSIQSPEIRAKSVRTCLEKYGVDYYVMRFAGKYIGENSPRWKGGVKYSRVERASHDYSTWRREVYFRDNYTCVKCGGRGSEIHAHHIFNWRDNPDRRYNVDNGITLCESCHNKFHSLYGKRMNNKEQIDEFLCADKKVC